VNTARASLVDEDALAEALRAGRIQVYATDTLSTESGSTSPLLEAVLEDRTIFTPHSAAQTVEAVDLMSGGAVDAVLAVLRGEQPPHLVTAPAAAPPDSTT
jgi:D-3-phosphoglycerate dehydrogenase